MTDLQLSLLDDSNYKIQNHNESYTFVNNIQNLNQLETAQIFSKKLKQHVHLSINPQRAQFFADQSCFLSPSLSDQSQNLI